jgi:thymidylate synthase
VSNIQEQYRLLLGTLLHNSIEKEDRTGTGTLSVFGRQIRHQMKDGFPLLTTKKMAVKTMMTELRWFLRGDTNIKYLVENGCNIWNGDAYKAYTTKLEKHWEEGGDIYTKPEFIDEIKNCENGFAEKWGELGPIYGKQWRKWEIDEGYETPNGIKFGEKYVDQISNLINELKTNPDSRRLMVSAWNVGELSEMTLPPCHYGFQVYTRLTTREEKIVNPGKYRAISLMWNQRSVDTFLGLPFNIASYAALLCLIAEEVNMIPDELIGNLGDVHLYKNHIVQATEQISREAYPLPQIKLSNVNLLEGEWDYELIDYKYHPSIKAPLSN